METIQAVINSYMFNEGNTQIQEYVKEVDIKLLNIKKKKKKLKKKTQNFFMADMSIE